MLSCVYFIVCYIYFVSLSNQCYLCYRQEVQLPQRDSATRYVSKYVLLLCRHQRCLGAKFKKAGYVTLTTPITG